MRTKHFIVVVCAAVLLAAGQAFGAGGPGPLDGAKVGGHSCVVVLDPGHGGDDRGAVGPSGLLEKTVAFGVADEAARLINEGGECRALLTRSSDVFVPLEERTAFANGVGADLFISIHANAAPTRGKASRGIETYFMSLEPTDEDARLLAEAENGASPFVRPAPRAEDDLAVIMDDLTDTEAHHASFRFAEAMQARLVAALKRGDRGVKQAGFTVLAGAAMPAVLVEVGFISNPAEEKMLASASWREKLSRAIAEAAVEFNGFFRSGIELSATGKK